MEDNREKEQVGTEDKQEEPKKNEEENVNEGVISPVKAE